MQSSDETIIYYGSRKADFKNMIISLLNKGKLKKKYHTLLTNEESMKIFSTVFTSTSADENNNYEVYEQLGDITVNKFIICYMYKRFPKLHCTKGVKVVARLRINYGSKQSFANIAETLGFWSFITASEEERNRNKKPLLEDTLEAFFGAVEYIIDNNTLHGVGYAVVYSILSVIFDEIDISLKYENLYDAKTRLKELFDFYGEKIGTMKYVDSKNEEKITKSTVFQIFRNTEIVMGEGYASLKADAQQKAANYALQYLKKKGFEKPIPEIYKYFL
jgi:dsRNA-specific ribonuclease